jgi:hypothetical protein
MDCAKRQKFSNLVFSRASQSQGSKDFVREITHANAAQKWPNALKAQEAGGGMISRAMITIPHSGGTLTSA